MGDEPSPFAPTELEPTSADDSTSVELRPGSRLGRYVVGERVGEGGMGMVFAGHDPELDRRVALKVVRARATAANRAAFNNVMRGLFGDEPTRTEARSLESSRLLREAQAAASLSHPNVITIHDVGQAEVGIFIAMEFIEGRTLREWLREATRTPDETLAMLCAAGRGLAAAHDAGLVHRDFKPDNVMIANDGRVLVLDFGLVRGSDTRGSDPPVVPDLDALSEELTRDGAVLGTPAYMAPEQCYGFSTDARTDQFSFCVAVWEALVGTRPFRTAIPDLLDRPLEPPSHVNGMPPWRFAVLQRGLSLEPRHRYPSMATLLEALVTNPHAGRLRRRILWGLAALVALAGSAWSARNAVLQGRCENDANSIDAVWSDDARDHIRSAFAETGVRYAQATADRVVPTLDAFAASWREVRREACEADAFGNDPDGLAQGTMRCLDGRADTLAALLDAMDSIDVVGVRGALSATDALRPPPECAEPSKALRALEAKPLSEEAEVIGRDLLRVSAYEAMGRYRDALAIARDAAERADALGVLRSATQYRLGVILERNGKFDEAALALENGATAAAEEGEDARAAGAAIRLAYVLAARQGKVDEALDWARWAESYLSRVDADNEMSAISLHGELGLVYGRQGDLERQLEHHRRALELARAVEGETHPGLVGSLNNLSGSLTDIGRTDEARALLEEAVEIQQETLPEAHPNVAMTLSNLARLHWMAEDTAAAVDAMTRALAIFTDALGPDHPQVGESHGNLALILEQQGQQDAALEHYSEALRIAELRGKDNTAIAQALMNLAGLERRRGDLESALAKSRRGVEIFRAVLGPKHPELGRAEADLARVFLAMGRPADAIEHFTTAQQTLSRALPPEDPLHETLARELEEARAASNP